jgi:hypothetical protein
MNSSVNLLNRILALLLLGGAVGGVIGWVVQLVRLAIGQSDLGIVESFVQFLILLGLCLTLSLLLRGKGNRYFYLTLIFLGSYVFVFSLVSSYLLIYSFVTTFIVLAFFAVVLFPWRVPE